MTSPSSLQPLSPLHEERQLLLEHLIGGPDIAGTVRHQLLGTQRDVTRTGRSCRAQHSSPPTHKSFAPNSLKGKKPNPKAVSCPGAIPRITAHTWKLFLTSAMVPLTNSSRASFCSGSPPTYSACTSARLLMLLTCTQSHEETCSRQTVEAEPSPTEKGAGGKGLKDGHSIPSHPIPFHPILFHSILLHPTLFCHVPFHPIQFSSIPPHAIPLHSIRFHPIPMCSFLFHPIPSHPLPFHCIPSYSFSFYPFPSHSIPFHPIAFHPILFYFFSL